MIVTDFMTRQVITVAPDDTILQAAKLMLRHRVSGLPVINSACHVIGIVSEHDLLRRHGNDDGTEGLHWLQVMIEQAARPGAVHEFHDRKVVDVMTPNVVSVSEMSSLDHASRLIGDLNIKRLPVVRDGKLVGIIARADLVRALAQSLEHAAPAPDVSVRQQLCELERQVWRGRARVAKPF
jgi:CBS domain-containing protein